MEQQSNKAKVAGTYTDFQMFFPNFFKNILLEAVIGNVQVSVFSLGLRLKEETDGKVVEGVYKWSPWYTTILI